MNAFQILTPSELALPDVSHLQRMNDQQLLAYYRCEENYAEQQGSLAEKFQRQANLHHYLMGEAMAVLRERKGRQFTSFMKAENLTRSTVYDAIKYAKAVKEKPEELNRPVYKTINALRKKKKPAAPPAQPKPDPSIDTTHELRPGDCLEVMPTLQDCSADLILSDLPFERQNYEWDRKIDLPKLWVQMRRIIKTHHVVVLFGDFRLAVELVNSNLEWFKFHYVWLKSNAVGGPNANHRPHTKHEMILVFSSGSAGSNGNNPIPYYPPNLVPVNKIKPPKFNTCGISNGNTSEEYLCEFTGYGHDVLEFESVPWNKPGRHPNEKPVPLLEYLIKTFTLPGQTVLDCCMGSGSTGEAARKCGRKFIGIEKDANHFKTAEERLKV